VAEPRSKDYDEKTDADAVRRPVPLGAVERLPNEARQAVTQNNVLIVLLIGLAGAILLLAVVWFAFFR
jgi:hypothetical protein